MTHNSLVNFKLKYFQLWTKESHQSPHFQIYRCSGENLPTSLCYFPTQKLVFLQILHHSKITKKDQSKCKFLGLLSVWIKTHQILIIFETQISFPSIFFSILSATKHNLSVHCKLKHYILWSKAAH